MIGGQTRGPQGSCARAPVAARTALRRPCTRSVVVQAYRLDGLPRAESCDVILSSGFLAFASHSGFLQGVQDSGVRVSGIMGTSAGALTGSLYAAGYTPRQAADELSRVPPISFLRPCLQPWKGGFLSLDGVIDKLRELLPPTFEELEKEFAVGVVNADGEHLIIDSGPLPEAVAASAAIPFIFSTVAVPGLTTSLKDGGVVDRVGLKAWRQRRRHQQQMVGLDGQPLPACLVHIIERSSPFSGCDDAAKAGEGSIHIVRSPKSGVNFFDLGDFGEQYHAARERSRISIETFRTATSVAAPSTSSSSSMAAPSTRSNVVPAPARGTAASTTSSSAGGGSSSSSLAGAGRSGVSAGGNSRVKLPGTVVAASTGPSTPASGVSARAAAAPRAQAGSDP